MPVGPSFQFFPGQRIFVGFTDQEDAEVPALWESGILTAGVVPSCPMNGRRRVAIPTRSCGAKIKIGCCTEFSGIAPKRSA